jgi:GNAT superfamily N-acetyltransferase
MDLFIAWDGDHIGRKVGQLALADDVEGLRRVSQAIEHGNQIWASWVNEVLGEMVSYGGDEGRARVPADRIDVLDQIRQKYASAVGSPVSVGVGMRLSEADRALLAAKLKGGDQIVLYTPEVESILATAEKEPSERQKIHDFYLGKADGEQAPQPPQPEMTPENKPNAGGGFTGVSEPGAQASPDQPVAEASEHSQGEAMQALADETSSPETTHSTEDFEKQLHDAAQASDKEDDDKEQSQDGQDQLRQQVAQILMQVRQQAPAMEQLRDQAPELYQATAGVVQALILMGRALFGQDDQQNDSGKVVDNEAQQPPEEQSQPTQKSEQDLEKASPNVRRNRENLTPQQVQARLTEYARRNNFKVGSYGYPNAHIEGPTLHPTPGQPISHELGHAFMTPEGQTAGAYTKQLARDGTVKDANEFNDDGSGFDEAYDRKQNADFDEDVASVMEAGIARRAGVSPNHVRTQFTPDPHKNPAYVHLPEYDESDPKETHTNLLENAQGYQHKIDAGLKTFKRGRALPGTSIDAKINARADQVQPLEQAEINPALTPPPQRELHSTVEGFMGGLKALPKDAVTRSRYITQHMSHPPFVAALQAHPQGQKVHGMLMQHLNSVGSAGFKAGQTVAVAKAEKDGCKHFHVLWGGKMRCIRCKKHKDLKKMAVRDLAPGAPVETDADGEPQEDGSSSYDYSHLLNDQHRGAGYALHLDDRPKGSEIIPYVTHNGMIVGSARAWLRPNEYDGKDVRFTDSHLDAAHRGKGLGSALYEAAMVHGMHHHGATHVSGSGHSDDARAVHERLSVKHGMKYVPGPPGYAGADNGPYEYQMKSDASLEKGKLPLPEHAPKHTHLNLPVGSSKDGKVKVFHPEEGKQGWVSVRAGQVLSNDGHPVSSRNPGGR